MTDDDWTHITETLTSMRAHCDRHEAALDGLMIAPESPLYQTYWKIEGLLLASLGRIADDDFDSLIWYVYECDYGRKPKEAGQFDDMRLIDSYDRLRWLIEIQSRDASQEGVDQ